MPNRDDIAALLAGFPPGAIDPMHPRIPFSGQTIPQFAQQNLPQLPRSGSIDFLSNPEYFNEISRAQGNSPGVTVGPGTPFDTPMTSGGPPPPPPQPFGPGSDVPLPGQVPTAGGPPPSGQLVGGMDPQEWLRLYRGG